MDEVLKLNLEYGTINIKIPNQIAQKCRSSQPDRGELEDHIEVTNQIAQMEKKFLNRSWKVCNGLR